jgi:RNA polymerase sigma-70 factor (ECF subfamily)
MSVEPSNRDDSSHEEFVALFARHQRRVFAYIGTLLPHLDDAEEVMQETSIILWRKWGEFDRERDFVRWANGIAHREVLRYLRQRKSGRIFYSEEVIAQIADEYERQSPGQGARQAALAECVKKLGDEDRSLVQRRYQESTSVAQIAASLQRPAKSIYRSLSRVRERLLQCVQRALASGDRE